jgi:hypothetical protein
MHIDDVTDYNEKAIVALRLLAEASHAGCDNEASANERLVINLLNLGIEIGINSGVDVNETLRTIIQAHRNTCEQKDEGGCRHFPCDFAMDWDRDYEVGDEKIDAPIFLKTKREVA